MESTKKKVKFQKNIIESYFFLLLPLGALTVTLQKENFEGVRHMKFENLKNMGHPSPYMGSLEIFGPLGTLLMVTDRP